RLGTVSALRGIPCGVCGYSDTVLPMTTREKAERGKRAAEACLALDSESKDEALASVADALRGGSAGIAAANDADLAAAGAAGLAGPLLKRLRFDEAKIRAALDGIEALRRLPDPVGRVLSARRLDEGLVLRQVSCPIGLVAMVFESRPDALVQMACLAAKSGNALILKGGSEAAGTNGVLCDLIATAGVR